MKKILAILTLVNVIGISLAGQSVSINTSSKGADSSAILDVSSTNKGVLITRMTTNQRLAIIKPALGLMVYDIDVNCLCIFSGEYWQFLCDNYNLDAGLIAYYKFNDNFGDSSGNGLHANAFGAPLFSEDRFGNPNRALTFDGNNDYLIVNDNGLANVPAITISYWYKTVLGRPQELISRLNYSNATNFAWVTATRSSTYAPINYDANFTTVGPYACNTTPSIGGENVLYSNQTVNLGEWYHIVCSFSNGFQKIYVNGKLKGVMQRSFTALPMCSPSQIVFGSWWANDPQYFGGSMDDVRIYSRILNDKEVEQLYLKK